jgi:hypothetical protein
MNKEELVIDKGVILDSIGEEAKIIEEPIEEPNFDTNE